MDQKETNDWQLRQLRREYEGYYEDLNCRVRDLDQEAQRYWELLCANGLHVGVPTDKSGKHKRPYPLDTMGGVK
jgi:hypothetical protein